MTIWESPFENFEWGLQLAKASLKLTQTVGGILKMHRASVFKPAAPVVEIYKVQARGGHALWGRIVGLFCSTSNLMKVENNFMRQLLGLPRSTPRVPLHLDLGMRPIEEELALRPLTFWRRLWVTPELSSYKAELKEIVTHCLQENTLALPYQGSCAEDGQV